MILLTGATGYVGGRLLPALEAERPAVRCLARRPEFLRPRVGPRTEIVQGDVTDPASLGRAVAGVQTAYYLIHSMGAGAAFEEADRQAAPGLRSGRPDGGRPPHRLPGRAWAGAPSCRPICASRHEVGEILRRCGVPTIELRASIVIGSGSLSFEMIRALVDQLPVMITPQWVRMRAQPIAIEDVIAYLVAAMDARVEGSRSLRDRRRRPDLLPGDHAGVRPAAGAPAAR